jgi:uracil-DNA glycosylase
MFDNRLREPLDHAIDRITGEWREVLECWRGSAPGRALIQFVDKRVAEGVVVFPADVFRALAMTPLENARVVILGQDPYHGLGQAEGLAFSVPPGQQLPPSLRNIFKEIKRDLGWKEAPASGHLGAWALSGVLLLNTSLTVEEGRPGSHAKRGWEALTDGLVKAAAGDPSPKVFMLWGGHAQSKAPLIAAGGRNHLVLESNHPSPLSATRGPQPFIGCGHFGIARDFVGRHSQGKPSLTWSLS